MLCAAIDIGSNTTRVLVAEPVDGQLKKVMEQRAYTRINKALGKKGEILPEKVEEVCEVVATQVRLARELGAEEIRAVATAAVREASNGEQVAAAIGEAAGVRVDVLSERGGGPALLHRRDQGPGPPGRGPDRRRRRRRRLDRDHHRHRHRRGRRGALLAGRLRRPRRRADRLRPALGGGDPQGPRPHRRHLRGSRDRAPGAGRRRRRQRHVAAATGRHRARVRDPGAGHPRPLRRPLRRRRPPLRARPASGSASSPPASCSWRRSPSCSASPCRSARAACARGSSSTFSTATPTGRRRLDRRVVVT